MSAKAGDAQGRARCLSIWEEEDLRPPPRDVDLERLGSSIRKLPPSLWSPRMFFHGAPDTRLRDFTGEVFPATFRGRRTTHPLFVLQRLPKLGHKVCPCSSKNWGASRYLRGGCRLEITGKHLDRDVYLVEDCAFNLPRDERFATRLRFMGLVPEDCVETCSE